MKRKTEPVGGNDDSRQILESAVKEIEATKRLLVLLLAKLGSDSQEIAMALGVDSSTVRRMISMKKVTKLPLQSDP